MAVKIEIIYNKTVPVACTLAEAFAYCQKYETAIPDNFSGLESFLETEKDTYEWVFEKVAAAGHEVQITFETRFQPVGRSRIDIIPVPGKSTTALAGSWKFSEIDGRPALTMDIKLVLDLPVPFFMKGMATSLAQKELGKLFDRYMANVAKALWH